MSNSFNQSKQVIFIDQAVPDCASILAGLEPGSIDYVIDNSRDGLQQMADILSGYAGLDAIHLISHGSPGCLQLGNHPVTQYTLGDYGAALATIGAALTDAGDLLLYGCNVAQGEVGQSFIAQLATATGADVAASVDLTGAGILGGNWLLEAATGPVEASAIAISADDTATPATAWVLAYTPPPSIANATPTGSVTVIGTAKLGETLTASNTLADADGLGTISYQWKADNDIISGASVGTFTLTQAQLGAAITVVANYTDAKGTAESVVSGATSTVTNALGAFVFFDDFNNGVRDRAGYTFLGNNVTEHNGYLDVQNAQTDASGIASLEIGRSLTAYKLEVNWYVHYVDNFAAPTLSLSSASNSAALFVELAHHDFGAFYNNDAANYNHVNTIVSDGSSSTWGTTGVLTDTMLDQWVTTTLTVDTRTGQTQLDLTSDGTPDLTATYSGLIGHSVDTVTFNPSGRSTGNYEKIDWVRVTDLNDKTANLTAYSWKSHTLLNDVSLSDGTHNGTTDANGTASLTGMSDASLTLPANRAVSTAETAITDQSVNLQDAIAILKMIVGLDVNGAGKPLSPYQAYAADFDGNGTVGLTDAIGVLKHVVGLTAPDPQWLFFDETNTGIATKANLNPGTVPAMMVTDLSVSAQQVHLGLVGVLRGDVDGSFTGVSGSQNLDVTQSGYFQNLANDHGLNLSQFGIYA